MDVHIRRTSTCLAGLLVLAATAVLQPVASQAAQPPIPKVSLNDASLVTCTDGRREVFKGYAHTYASLVRGPLYAPVAFWIGSDRADPKPVLPLQFTSTLDSEWRTVDSGAALTGWIGPTFTERPLGLGPAVTYTGDRVTCSWSMRGYFDFGTFTVTRRMATTLGLPAATVGRTVQFSGEGDISTVTPRYLFPTTATRVAPTLPTPSAAEYWKLWFQRPWSPDPLSTQTVNGGMACRRFTDHTSFYRGAAWTLLPLVRGYHWSPMAFWLPNGRLLTPESFWTYTGDGDWTTTDAKPVRTGIFSNYTDGRPSGYDGTPDFGGVECRWDNPFDATYKVTSALLKQVPELPADLLGRTVRLHADYSQTYAYVPEWQFR